MLNETSLSPSAETGEEDGVISRRRVALTAGVSLLLMAVLAPLALFGVLQTLVVPTDATATFDNIVASQGLFRSGIAAFLIVIMLDVVVAWALYVLLAPVNRTLALLTAWLRLAFAAVFGSTLVSLLDAAQLVAGARTIAAATGPAARTSDVIDRLVRERLDRNCLGDIWRPPVGARIPAVQVSRLPEVPRHSGNRCGWRLPVRFIRNDPGR